MFLETGYIYHIKDKKLMKNHENGNTRLTILYKNANSKVLWFIPMSSKVEKYRKLQKQKYRKMEFAMLL